MKPKGTSNYPGEIVPYNAALLIACMIFLRAADIFSQGELDGGTALLYRGYTLIGGVFACWLLCFTVFYTFKKSNSAWLALAVLTVLAGCIYIGFLIPVPEVLPNPGVISRVSIGLLLIGIVTGAAHRQMIKRLPSGSKVILGDLHDLEQQEKSDEFADSDDDVSEMVRWGR